MGLGCNVNVASGVLVGAVVMADVGVVIPSFEKINAKVALAIQSARSL